MRALGIVHGAKGVQAFDLPKPEIRQADDVLVRVKRVGIDGTDFNIVRNEEYDLEEGRHDMALGHEMVGFVELVGSSVKSLIPGDPVTMTVRRGCGQCHPCLHNQSDMCMTGLYTERGIHKLDGYLTELVVDSEQYVVKVPVDLVDLAVFTEPVSIAEKAIQQVRIIQSRLPWACPHPEHSFSSDNWGLCLNALVVGAGPLGLLSTALLRLHGIETYVSDIVSEDSIKAHMVKHMGAHFVDVRSTTPGELVKICSSTGSLNMIIEASGAANTALELIGYLSRSSIYVMTGIPRPGVAGELDAAKMIGDLVRKNQVIVGSVNSNRTHFEMALRDIAKIEAQFGGMLEEMITHRYPMGDFRQAFAIQDPARIKTVIEVEPES